MVISSKRNKPYHPPLQMNDHDLHVVNSHKHLGLIISDNGQWNDHIDCIVKKTYNRLNIMRKSRTFLDRYSLEKDYISFIRPLMEYADVIWDNQKQNLINKLENIQLNAARIVTGGTRSTSHDSLYEEAQWEKLKDRRNNHKLS
jgi:hypothetical protein